VAKKSVIWIMTHSLNGNDEVTMDLTRINQKWLDELISMRDMILGNLVMVAQIPAETFQESERAEFVLNRFNETENMEAYEDESGNVVAVIKGRTSDKKVAISASMDTHFNNEVDHNVSMSMDGARGPGLANNSLGLTVLLSLPDVFKKLGLEFNCDLVLVATTKSLGRGDIEGMRHFIKTYPFELDYVLNLVGTSLGRVDHFSHSAVRGDISCMIESPEEFSVTGFGENNAIIILNELINSLLTIPLSTRPKTSLNIGTIRGGESYSTPCPTAFLNLYIHSEDDAKASEVMQAIRERCIEIGSKNDVNLEVTFFGRQRAAGLSFGHPLVKAASQIVEILGFRPAVEPTNTQITVPLSRGIPSITLGITTGKKDVLPDGYIQSEHVPKGILQILMLLEFIDKELIDG
jgi:acetylornithine deacetylase/succinyl-diaminopimelate desuccinylase-like protein